MERETVRDVVRTREKRRVHTLRSDTLPGQQMQNKRRLYLAQINM